MKQRSSQQKFQTRGFKIQYSFGGQVRTSRASRGHRPLNSKLPVHFILKSSLAKGEWSFRNAKNLKAVHLVVLRFCKKYGIKVYQKAVVGNHIHILAQFPSREIYRRWVRGLSSAIAMAVTKTSKLKAALSGRSFWDHRPFTRVVVGLHGYMVARDYVKLNEQEAMGNISYNDKRTASLADREWMLLMDWKDLPA